MKRTKKLVALIITISLLMGCAGNANSIATALPDTQQPIEEWQLYNQQGNIKRTQRDATGKQGMVATSDATASQIGIEILQSGGNAIDAAVAIGFSLGVIEPYTSGIGGGGFMMIYSADTEKTSFIDFRETAPSLTHSDQYGKDAQGNIVASELSQGGKAVAIPGEVDGLLLALDQYGTLPRQQVLQPAIDLATNGFMVSQGLSNAITDSYSYMEKYPELGQYYLNEGFPYNKNELLKNLDLAKTLQIIAQQGRDGFYKGEVAQSFVDAVNKYDGFITLEDMANYRAQEKEAVVGTYRGYDIVVPMPPSSGGLHILQILNILENFDVSNMDVNSAEYLHLFSECFKMAFADNAAFMGDPEFTKVPVEGITSKEYAKELAQNIDFTQSKVYSEGEPYKYQSGSTTHYSVADQWGNIVSVTKTINNFFGSKVAVEGYGFIANNEMYDFSTDLNSVNCIQANKKPLSSMSPMLILKDGKPFATLGSPGGTRIFATLTQVVSKLIDHKMDLQDAVNAPRIFDCATNVVEYEKGENGIAEKEISALEALGHQVKAKSEYDLYFGGVQGVVFLEDGTLRGAADPRREGKAFGY